MPLASVYPLVTTRVLARPFTYEVEEGVAKGAVVSMPLGRSHVRGVVVGDEAAMPDGVRAVPVTRVVDEVPPALVDLALWVAEYYGSTPARALALVAPLTRARRGERRAPAESHALATEEAPVVLSATQEAALGRVEEALAAGGGHFLLWGETGSGKTEVYLRACAAAVARGRDAIVLVPEIALTPQTLGRFRARFGDLVAVLHSGLSEAERRDERERIAAGEARIVVGARSAVFAPVRSLGVVCVDEEHDPSYKQESDPRYDARTVAAKRAVARSGGRCVRQRDAAAGELGGARAARARRTVGDEPARRHRRRHAARGRLSAVRRARRRPGGRSTSAGAARSSSSTGAESPRPSTAARAARPSAVRTATSRSCCTGMTCCAATTAAGPALRANGATCAARRS